MRLRATKDASVVYDDGDYATNVQREDSSPPEKEKTKKKIALVYLQGSSFQRHRYRKHRLFKSPHRFESGG